MWQKPIISTATAPPGYHKQKVDSIRVAGRRSSSVHGGPRTIEVVTMSASRTTSARQRSANRVEKTLALIKPEAAEFAKDIEDIIRENGFEIVSKHTIRLTPDEVKEFYRDHTEQPYFQKLLQHMVRNSTIAMCISKLNAIHEWKQLIGPSNVLEAKLYWPDSIRAKYGMRNIDDDEYLNAVHGSENVEDSIRELNFFFPTMTIDPMLQGNYVSRYIQGSVNPTLMEGLNELCKEKPEDPIIWLADWLLTHNPKSSDDADDSNVEPEVPNASDSESTES